MAPELVMTAREAAQRQLLEDYESWMRDVQGRGAASCGARRAEARRFLSWGERQEPQLSVGDIGVSDLDRFIEERGTQLCRVSLSSLVDRLKNFLRYLHFRGEISCDLAATVRGPRIYTDEEIPSAFSAETVREVVQNSRRNRSPLGRRDHAICVLLATYGLRAGEIIGLRLEDIDWKNEVLRVRHFKTNQHSQLPLLRAPAQALLDYLRHGRPKTAVREVFLRALAPYRPLSCSASVHHIVQAIRFKAPLQVKLLGKGRKERVCPLWPETVALITALLNRQPRAQHERLFVNRYGEPLGAAGVRFKLAGYVTSAAKMLSSLQRKKITPHTFRHTVGVHLIAAGVDVTVIRNLLGHASLDTTNHYARADLETKRKALAQVDTASRLAKPPRWKKDTDLMAWLDSL